jgi:hypothetical protein
MDFPDLGKDMLTITYTIIINHLFCVETLVVLFVLFVSLRHSAGPLAFGLQAQSRGCVKLGGVKGWFDDDDDDDEADEAEDEDGDGENEDGENEDDDDDADDEADDDEEEEEVEEEEKDDDDDHSDEDVMIQ